MSADVARIIAAATPRTNRRLHSDVVALLVLLDARAHTVGEIARTIGWSQATASEVVNEAKEIDLVRRRRSAHDGRVVLVSLTAKGRRWRRSARDFTTQEVTE